MASARMRPISFNIIHLFVLLTVAALLTSVVVLQREHRRAQREVAELQDELEHSRPIPFAEVVNQISGQLDPTSKIKILGVRYDPINDAYEAGIYWEENSLWVGSWYTFKGDQRGSYRTELLHEPFATKKLINNEEYWNATFFRPG